MSHQSVGATAAQSQRWQGDKESRHRLENQIRSLDRLTNNSTSDEVQTLSRGEKVKATNLVKEYQIESSQREPAAEQSGAHTNHALSAHGGFLDSQKYKTPDRSSTQPGFAPRLNRVLNVALENYLIVPPALGMTLLNEMGPYMWGSVSEKNANPLKELWFPWALINQPLFHSLLFESAAYFTINEGVINISELNALRYSAITLINKRIGPLYFLTILTFVQRYDLESASFNGFQPRFSAGLSPSTAQILIKRNGQGSYFDSERAEPENLSIILSQHYFTVFDRVADLSSRLEVSGINAGDLFNSGTLFNDRASIIHSLLGLHQACEHNSSQTCICEVCRLALQVYLHLPLPKLYNGEHPILKLIMRLRLALETSEDILFSHPALFFWALFVGGIAAGPTERLWFVARLAKVVVLIDVSVKTEVWNSLLTICWTKRVCRVTGSQLWVDTNTIREVMQKRVE
ncbi:hypothetical protein F5884DRAFT_898905 [Xylogone sp. PMI_703]|nr:hypothetical protein F5884DRAFT_898905 [Xylogone sp. PMI_703]